MADGLKEAESRWYLDDMAAKTVDDYINATSGKTKETLKEARKLILATLPAVQEFMKWGTPAYGPSKTKPLFYLYAGSDHVNLGFIYGAKLHDPKGLLLGEGRKDTRHVHLASKVDLKKVALKRLIKDSSKIAT